ncbi:MAG: sigma 54-interacting transcriptional regulator [Planctomycetes bacterium]|nr:sigma 54-interacting transcriptional regulator [Planctomycetota bacterium]
MVDWNKIVESHVVKNFQKISLKWWGMDIRFYDASGNVAGNHMPIQNPLCSHLYATKIGPGKCAQNYRKHLRGINRTLNPLVYTCYAGVQGVAAPIFVGGNYVGAIVGSGALLPYNKSVKERNAAIDGLVRLGPDRDKIERCFQGLKQVSDHSEEYVLDFMKVIAKDITSFLELGESPAMKRVFDVLGRIEQIESTVLIEGESGTDKELIAAAVHYSSLRRDKVFISQNCAVFSETLFNSELFGHEKGAFTGATHDKKGLFEIADGGTLFLDEIGDMSKDAQARLLRVLEDGTFYSVGGTLQKRVDVRIIAATNKDLKEQVERGLFRKDLYYRINTIDIKLPPLRERKEDVPLLANHFLKSFAELHNVERKQISGEVIGMFQAYPWPGNIRELKNLMERMTILFDKSEIIEKHLVPEEIARASFPDCSAKGVVKGMKLHEALKSLEKDIVRDALSQSGWSKTVASNLLGISRASLNNKIAEFSLKPEKMQGV